MANVLATNTQSVLPLLSGAVEEGLLRWLRAAELTCDRAALLVAQDHRVVISALMKLAGGSPKLNAELNVEAFLRQVGLFTPARSTTVQLCSHKRHHMPCMSGLSFCGMLRKCQHRQLTASGPTSAPATS